MSQVPRTQDSLTTEVSRLIRWARQEGQTEGYAGKRRAPRYSEGIPLEITTNPKSASCRRNAYLHNVSTDGLACWCREKVLERSTLYVRWLTADGPGPWLPTMVTHCTVGIRGFLVGTAFAT